MPANQTQDYVNKWIRTKDFLLSESYCLEDMRASVRNGGCFSSVQNKRDEAVRGINAKQIEEATNL